MLIECVLSGGGYFFLNERVESKSGKSDGFSMYAADYHNECVEKGRGAGMIIKVPSSRIDNTKP